MYSNLSGSFVLTQSAKQTKWSKINTATDEKGKLNDQHGFVSQGVTHGSYLSFTTMKIYEI